MPSGGIVVATATTGQAILWLDSNTAWTRHPRTGERVMHARGPDLRWFGDVVDAQIDREGRVLVLDVGRIRALHESTTDGREARAWRFAPDIGDPGVPFRVRDERVVIGSRDGSALVLDRNSGRAVRVEVEPLGRCITIQAARGGGCPGSDETLTFPRVHAPSIDLVPSANGGELFAFEQRSTIVRRFAMPRP